MKHLHARGIGIGGVFVALLGAFGSGQDEGVQPGRARRTVDVPCERLPNGSFRDGFAGSGRDPSLGGFGTHNGLAHAEIVDLTTLGWDDDVACLEIVSEAIRTEGDVTGSAGQAQVSLSRQAFVTNRFLELSVIGEFEIIAFAAVDLRMSAKIVVRNLAGATAQFPIYEDAYDGAQPCFPGVMGLGVIPAQTLRFDLAEGGIRPGQRVTIDIVWSASVVALDECDLGSVTGSLCVDDLAFCDTPGVSNPLPITPIERTLDLRPEDTGIVGRLEPVERLQRAAAWTGVPVSRR